MQEFWAQEGLTLRTCENWDRRPRRAEKPRGHFVAVRPPVLAAGPWAVEGEFPNGVRLWVRG